MFRKYAKPLIITVLFITALPIIIIYSAVLHVRYESPSSLPSLDSISAKETRYAIEPVFIVDVENGQLLEDRQLLIKDGRISGINSGGQKLPEDYVRIDGRHAYVVPGLIDMHTHIYDRADLINSLAHGVTSVRNMRGMPMHLRFRSELENETWAGASLYTSSPILDNAQADLFQHALESKEDAITAVTEYKNRGYDFLKVYSELPEPILTTIIEQAAAISMPIAKHGPYGALSDGNADMTTLSKFQSVEHVEEIYQTLLRFNFDESKLDNYLHQIKQSGAFLTPTLATFDHLTELSVQKEAMINEIDLRRMNPFIRFLLTRLSVNRWLNASKEQTNWNIEERDVLLKITQRAEELGVPMLVGSDQGTMYLLAGVSTHKEMQLMQAAGMSTHSIIRSATLNAAKAMKLDMQTGSVSPGKLADLVLLRNNPLDDIAHLENPIAIIKVGRYIDQSGIDALSKRGQQPSSWITGFGYIAEDLLLRANWMF